MKYLVLTLISISTAFAAISQNYDMEIRLKDGSTQKFATDNITEVRFVKNSEVGPVVTNILTEECIPDVTLRNAIREQVAGGNETLTEEDAANYDGELTLADNNVANFKGIEYLKSLKSLVAAGVYATSLDLSALNNLEVLNINRSLVESLSINSDKLQVLDIGSTPLKNFDLSVLPSGMKNINVDNLGYESLDFTVYPDIEIINCSQNKLTDLKVNGLSKLTKIIFTANSLKEVSFEGCSALEFVAGSFNTELANVNLNGCNSIHNFMFMYTAIESFDTTPFASCIEEINLGWSKVKSLKIDNCANLTYLAVDNCGITESLDFSSCTKLDVLRIDGNEVPTLDLSACPDISEIQCSTNNSLRSIKLASRLTKLHQLNIDNVPALESLEWGATEKLQYANIYMTPLTRIDISKVNQNFYNIYLDYNDKLKEIKVWEGFDINNPPTTIQKPASAKFVYEYTE